MSTSSHFCSRKWHKHKPIAHRVRVKDDGLRTDVSSHVWRASSSGNKQHRIIENMSLIKLHVSMSIFTLIFITSHYVSAVWIDRYLNTIADKTANGFRWLMIRVTYDTRADMSSNMVNLMYFKNCSRFQKSHENIINSIFDTPLLFCNSRAMCARTCQIN